MVLVRPVAKPNFSVQAEVSLPTISKLMRLATRITWPDNLHSMAGWSQVAKVPLEELQVFDWLIHRVAPAFTKTSIHHTELVRLLATDNR